MHHVCTVMPTWHLQQVQQAREFRFSFFFLLGRFFVYLPCTMVVKSAPLPGRESTDQYKYFQLQGIDYTVHCMYGKVYRVQLFVVPVTVDLTAVLM